MFAAHFQALNCVYFHFCFGLFQDLHPFASARRVEMGDWRVILKDNLFVCILTKEDTLAFFFVKSGSNGNMMIKK